MHGSVRSQTNSKMGGPAGGGDEAGVAVEETPGYSEEDTGKNNSSNSNSGNNSDNSSRSSTGSRNSRNSKNSRNNRTSRTSNISRNSSMGHISGTTVSPLDAYDHVFWLGDVNYRVHIWDGPGCDTVKEYTMVQDLVNRKEFTQLQYHDQLTRERKLQNVFCGYQEAPISFPPTYRMNKGKPGYSNKRNQSASYTDRILFKSLTPAIEQHVTVRVYSAIHAMAQSDHRPVVLQVHVNTALPYVRLVQPSHFMGGACCEIVPTNIKVVVDELDVVITKMNDVYDASSDVIDPNPKKSKNPIKKLFRKIFKKKKNKTANDEQLNEGETTVGNVPTKGGASIHMKRVKSKRSHTEMKSAKHARSTTLMMMPMVPVVPLVPSVPLQEEGKHTNSGGTRRANGGHLRSQSGRQVATKGLGRTRSR